VHAQNNPFAPGWDLQPAASALRFQSVKNQTVVESSSFATFSGQIDDTGQATISILLDSVDTKIDLRNVRMRFLFFETFQYPEAKITMQLDATTLADLPTVRRKILTLPYTLELHGISKDLQAELAVTLVGDDLIAVSTSSPISIAVNDFGLQPGLEKLQEAASVAIVPSGTVTFDFIFQRRAGGSAAAETATLAPEKPASAALEAEGDFSLEACTGRFEILSRTGNIYFASGSAALDPKSTPLLDSIADIVSRCPGLVIQIAGHTDSQGGAGFNQSLSQKRAASVARYLAIKGIEGDRIVPVGFGESRPVATNGTGAGRAKNRRIEFAVQDN
jgi:outer membrane protein OmpA-like peptidoglycan-associated protein